MFFIHRREKYYMKKRIAIPTLVMFLGYILWNLLFTVYFIYFYPELEKRFIIGGIYKLIPGIFICAIFIFAQIRIEKIYSTRRNLLLCTSLIVTIIITCIDSYITTLIYAYMDKGSIIFSFEQFITVVANWLLFFFGSSILFYFIYYHRKSAEQELQLTHTQALANEARLMMLRYQINPHFLFNTLNTIQSVIQTDQERAKIMVGELSEFFRYTLSKDDQNFVSLNEEINAVKNYLSIQKERFGEFLDISYEIGPGVYNLKIPFFIIQPLVENAVKYGFTSCNNILKLLIKIEIIENDVKILVRNSGVLKDDNSIGLPDQLSTKTGIENIKKRLALLYPDSHKFSLYEENGFVNAVVTLKRDGPKSESSNC